MDIPAIDLSAFTWEAFATLVTGIVAVGGATLIGLRQVGISDRQSAIMERQVGLDELKLRSDLFDRRFAVYEATRQFLAEIVAHADEPEKETQNRFLWAVDQSRFLFSSDVSARLTDLWRRSCGFFAVKKMMKHQYDQTGDYGQANIDREYEYLTATSDVLAKLSDVFAEEMRLTPRTESASPATGAAQKL